MPFYIVQRPAHVTWYKYLVEADSDDQVLDAEGQYLGYVDGDWEEAGQYGDETEVSVAYPTEDEALSDELAWVEGHG